MPLLTTRARLGDLPAIPAAGGKTTYSIDTARNVHGLYLKWTISGVAATGAEMAAQIGMIRVRLAGKLVWELTAQEILVLYHFYNDRFGIFTEAGVLPLIFTPLMLPLGDDTKQYRLGMLSDRDASKRNTFTVEINMTAGAITVDACAVELETDDEPSEKIGYHIRWLRYGSTWAATSKQTLDKISLESNALAVLGYHIPTTGTIDRLSLKINDVDKIGDTDMDIYNLFLHRAGRTPQAGYYHIDFTLANNPLAFLDVSRLINQYLALTWSVAPTGYDILIQQLCKDLG
jgi:hypothetical protein